MFIPVHLGLAKNSLFWVCEKSALFFSLVKCYQTHYMPFYLDHKLFRDFLMVELNATQNLMCCHHRQRMFCLAYHTMFLHMEEESLMTLPHHWTYSRIFVILFKTTKWLFIPFCLFVLSSA